MTRVMHQLRRITHPKNYTERGKQRQMLEAEEHYVKFQEPETYQENRSKIFAILNAFTIRTITLSICPLMLRETAARKHLWIIDHELKTPAKLAIALPGLRVVEFCATRRREVYLCLRRAGRLSKARAVGASDCV